MPSEQSRASRERLDESIEWHDVGAADDVVPGTGAAVLVEGEQIAIVRRSDGVFAALSNLDPFSNASVISRGIVGDRDGVRKIASPMYKQSFSLETGECLDDPSVRLTVYPVRVTKGRIEIAIAARRRTSG